MNFSTENIAIITSFLTALIAICQAMFSMKSFYKDRSDKIIIFRYEKLYDFYQSYLEEFSKLDINNPPETVMYSRKQYDTIKFLLDEEFRIDEPYNELTEFIIEYIKNRDSIIEDSVEYEEFRQVFNEKSIKFDVLFKESLQKQLSKLYNTLN